MLWERSHTDISFKQATKPKIIRTLVPCYHYPFLQTKGLLAATSMPLQGL